MLGARLWLLTPRSSLNPSPQSLRPLPSSLHQTLLQFHFAPLALPLETLKWLPRRHQYPDSVVRTLPRRHHTAVGFLNFAQQRQDYNWVADLRLRVSDHSQSWELLQPELPSSCLDSGAISRSDCKIWLRTSILKFKRFEFNLCKLIRTSSTLEHANCCLV
ncbi:hypothetical protein M0R45_019012 [Rubus argutus]|uniref:Uncharacterized protein n=1 Tax=Rubus argutus TaxID=59490 RepID=A0AAW1X4P3_RUBAR